MIAEHFQLLKMSMVNSRFQCQNQREKVSFETNRLQKAFTMLHSENHGRTGGDTDFVFLGTAASMDQNALHLLSLISEGCDARLLVILT